MVLVERGSAGIRLVCLEIGCKEERKINLNGDKYIRFAEKK